jgi:hypothetical protein
MSVVFKKNEAQVAQKSEGFYINGWKQQLSNSNFATDSVNIMILKKGTYYITININVSQMFTNTVSFFCLNNKTNLPLENVSVVHINGPLMNKTQSTGIIHGLITVDSTLSFKVVSESIQGSLTIEKASQITVVES